MSNLAAGNNADAHSEDKNTPKFFKVGTLVYDKRQLWILFFWLMWNDFTIMLLEKVPSLTEFIMKDYGATYAEMAIFASIGSFFGIWINPVFSTWSDRTRTRLGRRRPFLFLAVPIFALSLLIIPYMPKFHDYITQYAAVASIVKLIPINSVVLFLGIGAFINGLCNAVVLALFSYYYMDVVPENVFARFSALSKIVTLMAGFIWSFYIFGWADTHMEWVFIVVSVICTVAYIISLIMVKEGEYPPPEARKKSGMFEPVKAYFKDCYSNPYYLWIFFGFFVYQFSNGGNRFQTFYLRDDLGMSYHIMGWCEGWGLAITTTFGVLFGFYLGSLTDRLKPIRLIPFIHVLWALSAFGCYLFVVDKWTFLIWSGIRGIVIFAYGVALGALTIEVFPREKLGQFCSANQLFQTFLLMILNPLIGALFDKLQNNRLGFLWQAVFQLVAAAMFVKIYFNWRKMEKEKAAIASGQVA